MRLTPLARWGKSPTDPAHLQRWLRTQRTDQSPAEYAAPITRYAHERAWSWCDKFAAGVLVGVVLALLIGLL